MRQRCPASQYQPETQKFATNLMPAGTDAADLLTLNPWIQPLQYLAWADRIGIFDSLARCGAATAQELAEDTNLNKRGADAFLGVLQAMGFIVRQPDGAYTLQPLARDYLVTNSPYYVGFSLYRGVSLPIPHMLRKPQTLLGRCMQHPLGRRLYEGIAFMVRPMAYGRLMRLREQHSRNLAAGVAAAHKPCFDSPRTVVDIAGGSGTFSIPLAQLHPEIAITLIELPRSVPNTLRFLRAYGVENRVRVLALDVLKQPEHIPPCDCIFIGNLIHDFGDADCLTLMMGCHNALRAGGSLCIHERIWNDAKDGPLLTAQWHFIMMSRSRGGKQRTSAEIEALLIESGFTPGEQTVTALGFTMVRGIRN